MAPTPNFNHTIAVCRGLASSFIEALSMHPPEVPVDIQRAEQEHAAYTNLLKQLVPTVIELQADDAHPDCCFVEDTAIVLGTHQVEGGRAVAVLSHPGAVSRRGEVAAVRRALETQLGFSEQPGDQHLLFQLQPPANLDGGDVLFTGSALWVGQSARTNSAAVEQLSSMLQGICPVIGLPMPPGEALHLKSLVTAIAEDALVAADTEQGRALILAAQALPGAWGPGMHVLWVPDMLCSNVLRIGSNVVFQHGYPRSEAIVRAFCEDRGLAMHVISMQEFAKVDGALTCCSLLFSL